MHTEFVTYTIFADTVAETPFDAAVFSIFPKDWLADAPGAVLTSALVRVEEYNDEADLDRILNVKIPHWFVPESLAASRVIDDEAIVAGDFRIDEAGHVRFAVLTKPDIGLRRLGRIVQRLLEIETYKTASMLTLPIARTVSRRVAELDLYLTEIVQQMAKGNGR